MDKEKFQSRISQILFYYCRSENLPKDEDAVLHLFYEYVGTLNINKATTAALFYRERFPDTHFQKLADEFWKEFWGYNPSDEKLAEIMGPSTL